MLTLTLTVAICIAFATGFCATVQFVTVRVLKYRLDEDGLSVVFLGRFRYARVSYSDISDVRVISWADLYFDQTLARGIRLRWWTNRFFTRKLVAVGLKDRRDIMLSPPNADAFTTQLADRVRAERHRDPPLIDGAEPLGVARTDMPATPSRVPRGPRN